MITAPLPLAAAQRPLLSHLAARAWRQFLSARETGEQAIMINRLLLAWLVFLSAAIHAHAGARQAQDFYSHGLVWLQAYLIAVAALQAHIFLRPAPSVTRRFLAVALDAAIISFGLHQGDAASAYLFPLYFWMILGNGVRLGPSVMCGAVVCSAAGFAVTVWHTPFWRAHVSFSTGLFLALIIIPIYGGLLLRRLAEAHAEAERANHAKTLLLACVSHELRTPLTAITGLGALLQDTELDDEQREMIQTLNGAAAILLRHIEALLTVSRDEIGTQAARPERVDLFALLVSLRALLAVEADKKGVRLGLSIDADTPRHIVAEPDLLLDIFQNLGGNAVKFTHRGAVAIHVGVGRRDRGRLDLRVEVLDTGIGIDAAAQHRIFDSFVQADPDISRRFGGSGLGLAIARRRLEARGGRIGVESDVGKGSRFWFELNVGIERDPATAAPEFAHQETAHQEIALHFPTLPAADGAEPFADSQIGATACLVAPAPFDALALARHYALAAVSRDGAPDSLARAREMAARLKELAAVHAPEAPAKTKAKSPAVSEQGATEADLGRDARRPLKILLAEDNGVNRMVLEKILSRARHQTKVVTDGEAALDAMLSGDFDVILLDVNMPGISGHEAARLYRCALPPEARAPIIALTADAGAACREQCEDAGMVGFLTKPLTPEILLRTVAAAARKSPEPDGREGEERRARPDAPATGGDILDPAALATLTALGGETFLRELILQFIGEGTQIVERMTFAVEEGDLAAFLREAHALDSSAGNIGASDLARLCRSWRDAGPGPFALYGDDFLDDLRREWTRVATALNGMLAKGARMPRPRQISWRQISRREDPAA
jgi:two-component system sensor histidine kinase RpfC